MLCAKNMEAGVWSTCLSACFLRFSSFRLTRSCLSLRRGSCFGFTVRLMARTLAALNFLALPIVTLELLGTRRRVAQSVQVAAAAITSLLSGGGSKRLAQRRAHVVQ